ncbi:MAG: lasso peptide isopeptide bond-forming cyclase [Acidobacteriota bacterium]|nr:lasso peptide isopeptide bond-forming cyclase [Acidobacteriota bacterium]
MSGIAGIFRRDGGPVSTVDLQRMLSAIAHRGPDRSDFWCEGSVGLGNCMLMTTPESLAEHLPSKHSSGNFVIAADARIDNRAELRETLRLGPGEAPADSDLILEAYARWGSQCAARLIGDFSFVIWDARRQTLFAAKDSAGIRSFYYYATPELFVFASEIKALRCLPEVPAVLNETRVGDYLINLYEDRSITFYEGILRLPPACTLTVTPRDLGIHTYWKLDPEREIRMKSDADYTEAFRHHFDEAVRCRTRAAHGIGSALSGGLDSSAIACTARNQTGQPLHTFSIIFPGMSREDLKVIDERSYIDKVLATGNFKPHFIRGDELSPMGDVERVHRHLDEANFAPNLYLHWAMYSAAQQNNVRVFLDGLDGDTTVSHGFETLEEMARRLQFTKLRNEASLLAKNLFEGSTTRRVLWNYCAKDIAPVWMFRLWRLLRGRFREVRANSTLVDPQFTRKLNLRQRARALSPPRNHRTARAYHHKALTFALYPHALEMADKASAAFGVEARYPFFDRRLIEFCLALPAEQKLGQGWNRLIFRRAMEGVLPPEIQWRGSKGNLSPNFHRRLLELDGDNLERVASGAASAAQGFLHADAMRRALAEYRAAPLAAGGKNSIQLFTAANLALWLEQSKLGRSRLNHPA